MTLQRPIATSFNGGELSPRMGGRVDTAVYQVGAAVLENFIPTVEGALVKRPGFEHIEDAAPGASWLSAFRFDAAREYLLEWSDRRLRFFAGGARVETAPGVPLELAVPYSAAEAPFVATQQSFDRLYLAHPAHPPARLTRTGPASFTYEPLPLANGPFADANADRGVTVSASDTTGAVTLTASAPIFAPGHAGAFFRVEAANAAEQRSWQVGIAGITPGTVYRNDGIAYTATSAGRTGTNPPRHTEGEAWDGDDTPGRTDINGKGPFGVRWAFRHDRFGVLRLGSIAADGRSATAQVIRRLPDSLVAAPTHRWAHGAFSAAAGWPNLVVATGGRLILIKRFELFASVSGDYLNHATHTTSGVTATDLAFRRTLSTPDPALWAIADRNRLLIGTASREIAVGAINAAQPLAGDNIEAVPQSYFGSAPVTPQQIGTQAVFVQRGGRKLRQADYDFARDRYAAENLTVWCRHVTASGIRQLAFQKDPEELLVAVRGDGQLVVHPHAPEQEIKGFARIVHGGGAIRSAACLAGADGVTDELWVLVERDGGGVGVERMAAWREDDAPRADAFFLDSATAARAAPGQQHFSGAIQLAGARVDVLADGGVIRDVRVNADGAFTLPATSVPRDRGFRVVVGRRFTALAVTLRPELRGDGQSSQGKRQRVVALVLRLLDTAGIRIGARAGPLDALLDRSGDDAMDAGVPLFSGDSTRSVSGGWDRTGQARFVSDAPLPAVVVAAMLTVEVGS
ncbi:hypothetical protein [Sphingomonas sp. BK235]|uniref:hypothetical protein n=1 Tax=Sphingomonas sp. BK235 TaxID=2512131 RepID=UPI0010DF77FA|nr:hypothetical protein [Sphingomonas sp. BK235]TCP35914.1 hypothetical protein EV292_102504 [Sphingomonas sp. BK235]